METVRYQRLAPRTKCSISSTAGPHSHHHRAADDAVADVELLDLRNGGDGHHVAVGESMAGMHEQAHVGGMPRGPPQLVERRIAVAPGVGVAAGVELDRGHAEVLGGVERGGSGSMKRLTRAPAWSSRRMVSRSRGIRVAAGRARLRW